MLLYLTYDTHGKIWKSYTKTINLKYQLQCGIKNLNDLVDHILYQILKIMLSISSDIAPIRIYVNKIENRITFIIKTKYYFELLTFEIMKLFGSTKSKINKDKDDGNISHLKIIELVLIHSSITDHDYEQDSRLLHTFVPNK